MINKALLKGVLLYMTEKEIVEEIKLELTGDLDEMELEIDDQTIANAVKKSLRELQRY